MRRVAPQASPVSIRRADFWRLEPDPRTFIGRMYPRFNPPGGFLASGTEHVKGRWRDEPDVSIRRADFWRLEPASCCPGLQHSMSFNPPGGFLASGTLRSGRRAGIKATRFNPPGGFLASGTYDVRRQYNRVPQVSIRRADFWRLELRHRMTQPCQMEFQSAGRIFGVWNAYDMFRDAQMNYVSIRRADFWRLERAVINASVTRPAEFQSAGRIFGVWNSKTSYNMRENGGFNPPGGFLASGTAGFELRDCVMWGFNPPGGFLASGTLQD